MLRKIILLVLFLWANGLQAQPDLATVIGAYQPITDQPPNPLSLTLTTAKTHYPELSKEQPPIIKDVEPTPEQRFIFFHRIFTNPDEFCIICRELSPEENIKRLIDLIFPNNRLMNWEETLSFFVQNLPDYAPLTLIHLLEKDISDFWDSLIKINLSPQVITNMIPYIFSINASILDNNQKKLLQFCLANIMQSYIFTQLFDYQLLAKSFASFIMTIKPQDAASIGFQNLGLWRNFAFFLAQNIAQDDNTTLERAQLLKSIVTLMGPAFFEKGKMPDDQLWLDLYTVNPHAFDRTLKIYLSDEKERFFLKTLIQIRSYINKNKYILPTLRTYNALEPDEKMQYITKPLIALRDLLGAWKDAPKNLKKEYLNLSKRASDQDSTLSVDDFADLLGQAKEQRDKSQKN